MGQDKAEQQQQASVSESYIVAMGRREETLVIPGFDPGEAFITAVHPGEAEDDILRDGLTVQWTAPSKRAKDQDVVVKGSVGTARGFVAKCIYQITGYKLPVAEVDGKLGVRQYNSKNGGDNRDNRDLYTQLLGSPFRELIEEFLDMVGGRSELSAEDFEDLKNELTA